MTIVAAADGSALGNPGPAGWAWYVDDERWAAGGWKHATNNQGELAAVLELFRATAHLDEDLLVLCDSQYVINSVTKWMRGWKAKGWRKGDGKPVMNLDLLKQIDAELVGRSYRFEWVKGHANHPLNEAADLRARAAAEAFQRGRPVDGGPGFPGSGDARESTATSIAPESDLPEPASKESGAPRQHAVEPPSLFDLADAELLPEPSAEHAVTVYLDQAQLTRLTARARERGISIDAALRDLI